MTSHQDEPRTPRAAVTPWIEKWLLIGLIAVGGLIVVLMFVGTAPARRTEVLTRDQATLLCLRVWDNMENEKAQGRPVGAVTTQAFDDLCGSLISKYKD